MASYDTIPAMSLRTCDGSVLRRAVSGSLGLLLRHAAEVDALNVFPVPDGDTGRNMAATLRAAVAETERVTADGRSAGAIGAALARGALLGSRGNSGVILSQVLRGMADAAHGKRRVDGRDLAAGLRAGSRLADASIDRPVEGTILSVVRAAAEAAEAAAQQDPAVERVLEAAVEAAAAAVARTPEQLRVLAEAGVVDAGGRGFELILRGALAAFAELPDALPPAPPAQPADLHALAGEGEGSAYGYETAYLIDARPGLPLDLAALRAELGSLGDSLLVVGDPAVARIHIHGDRPDLALAVGLRAGRVSRVTIENLDALAAGDREERVGELLGAGAHAGVGILPPTVPALPAAAPALAVVAVADGDGFARVIVAAGGSVVRATAGHERPSTGELLAGVRATGAGTVLLLPNDRNVRLAAEQVVALATGVQVTVIPTRNAAEGIAALLAFDPRAEPVATAERMRNAAAGVRSAAIAVAVRDARVSGREVRAGETIALDPDEGLIASGSDPAAVILAASRAIAASAELLTVHYGASVAVEEAIAVGAALEAALPGVAIEVSPGGQAHHSYLLAAE